MDVFRPASSRNLAGDFLRLRIVHLVALLIDTAAMPLLLQVMSPFLRRPKIGPLLPGEF